LEGGGGIPTHVQKEKLRSIKENTIIRLKLHGNIKLDLLGRRMNSNQNNITLCQTMGNTPYISFEAYILFLILTSIRAVFQFSIDNFFPNIF